MALLSTDTITVKEKEKEVFSFEEKLILDALKTRGYTEDEIVDFVNASRTHCTPVSKIVERFEQAKKDVKGYFNPTP